MHSPVAADHRRMVLSHDPEAIVWPSGLKATLVTQPVWPLRVDSTSPEAVDQRRTVASCEAEASVLPSGLKATPHTWLKGKRGINTLIT